MSLDDLRVFLAVAHYQSFTLASERLGMPKASVSRAVVRMEGALGQRLLERSTRSLRLTEAGAQLSAQTASLVARLEDHLQQAVAQHESPQGRLRIAAPYELGMLRLGDVLNEMLLRFPALQAEIVLTTNLIDPRNEDFDIVFRVQLGPLPDSSQVVRRIYSIARGLYAAPALLQRLGPLRSAADLAGWPAVLSPEEPVWQLSDAEGNIDTVRLTGSLCAQSVGMRLSGVMAGLGVGLLATNFCRQEIQAGRIVPVLPALQVAPMRVYALLPARRLMPTKVRLFLDALAQDLASADGEGR